ncbi:hypothetical protein [Polaromonas sp. YR568]|uniref:hypothetical protein n=1 Tax=Polaromonas sp. YR568 TaxID=1855301 RepID=UPI00398BFECE
MAKPQTSAQSQATPDTTNPASGQGVVLTDSLGRELKIKPIGVLYESQLVRMLGTEVATNPSYMMGFVYPATSVYEIDGVPCPRPSSQHEVDQAIQRLGREGFAALLVHMQTELEKIQKMVENNPEAKPQ